MLFFKLHNSGECSSAQTDNKYKVSVVVFVLFFNLNILMNVVLHEQVINTQ